MVRAMVEACRQDRQGSVSVYDPYYIQLKVDQQTQVHFWGVPGQEHVTQTGLHNHYVDFTSEVVLGALTNRRYALIDHPEGKLRRYYVERWRNEDGLWQYRVTGGTQRTDSVAGPLERYVAGDRYAMRATEYHTTEVTQPTITIMRADLGTHGRQEMFLEATADADYVAGFVPEIRSPKDAVQLDECWGRIDGFLGLLEKETHRKGEDEQQGNHQGLGVEGVVVSHERAV